MVIWVGSVVGALFGLAHAAYVYRITANEYAEDTGPNSARGFYYALWTIGLWILFGSYVLVLWLVSITLYGVFKVFR